MTESFTRMFHIFRHPNIDKKRAPKLVSSSWGRTRSWDGHVHGVLEVLMELRAIPGSASSGQGLLCACVLSLPLQCLCLLLSCSQPCSAALSTPRHLPRCDGWQSGRAEQQLTPCQCQSPSPSVLPLPASHTLLHS